MKSGKPDSIFQFPERCLDTPPHSVKFFEFLGRKIGFSQICDDSLINIISYFEPDNPKKYGIKLVLFIQEVKSSMMWQPFVNIRLVFDFI
jgi:hypothetical protein